MFCDSVTRKMLSTVQDWLKSAASFPSPPTGEEEILDQDEFVSPEALFLQPPGAEKSNSDVALHLGDCPEQTTPKSTILKRFCVDVESGHGRRVTLIQETMWHKSMSNDDASFLSNTFTVSVNVSFNHDSQLYRM